MNKEGVEGEGSHMYCNLSNSWRVVRNGVGGIAVGREGEDGTRQPAAGINGEKIWGVFFYRGETGTLCRPGVASWWNRNTLRT